MALTTKESQKVPLKSIHWFQVSKGLKEQTDK